VDHNTNNKSQHIRFVIDRSFAFELDLKIVVHMNAHTESAGDIHHKESNRDRELSPAHRYLLVVLIHQLT
jgi:hypothetical protein